MLGTIKNEHPVTDTNQVRKEDRTIGLLRAEGNIVWKFYNSCEHHHRYRDNLHLMIYTKLKPVDDMAVMCVCFERLFWMI